MMFDREFTSVEEVVKIYDDHLASLEASGVDFDRAAVLKEKAVAIANFSLDL